MEFTVLQVVQNVLSSLNSDEVNSISDTAESMQVAQIAQNVYYNMASRGELTEHSKLIQLTPSTDPVNPVVMQVPNEVVKIEWIKYYSPDVDDEEEDDFEHDLNLDIVEDESVSATSSPYFYRNVTILPTTEFINRINLLNPQESDVTTYNFFNFNLRYKNDKKPEFCMSLQNQYIVFDSYDSTVDSTLQAAKTMCWAQTVPDFLLQDSFVPVLDDQQFPLLINETKAWAFYELKQTQHPKAELETRRQWSALQKNKSVTNKPSYFDQLPNFGRRPYYISFGSRYKNSQTIW
jgi:hypothetical protein